MASAQTIDAWRKHFGSREPTEGKRLLGYASRMAVRDAEGLGATRLLAAPYPRYGYRTIRILFAWLTGTRATA